VYLVQVFLLLIGQQGLVYFFRYLSLLPISWRIVQILRQRRKKTTNIAQTTLSAGQAATHQAKPLLSVNNCTPLVISRNDKIYQLTLSHRKLALKKKNGEKYNFGATKSMNHLKHSETSCVPAANFCQNV
jgi:hypothetical protein